MDGVVCDEDAVAVVHREDVAFLHDRGVFLHDHVGEDGEKVVLDPLSGMDEVARHRGKVVVDDGNWDHLLDDEQGVVVAGKMRHRSPLLVVEVVYLSRASRLAFCSTRDSPMVHLSHSLVCVEGEFSRIGNSLELFERLFVDNPGLNMFGSLC